MGLKQPYTENTLEAQNILEHKGFDPLRFFQGKKYIYAMVGITANARAKWKVFDYATFNEDEKTDKPFLTDSPVTLLEFEQYLNTLKL